MSATVLLDILRNLVREAMPRPAEVALAYSGGLDSSVLAALAGEVGRPNCYTCATPKSYDARMAVTHASEQGLKTNLLVLTPESLISYAGKVSRILETTNPSQIAYTIPFVCVVEESLESTVLGGQGADEVFGGYAKYQKLEDPSGMMAEDLEKMRTEVRRLQEAFSEKKLAFPFADRRVVEFSCDLSNRDLVGEDDRKIMLRNVAKLLALPSQSRPKKAAQYSSGILKEMKCMAQKDGIPLKEWTEAVVGGRRPTP